MSNSCPWNIAVSGLLGSSILVVISCGYTQWNLKKPPIILSNSGHVPTCVSRPCGTTCGAAGGGGGKTDANRATNSGWLTLPRSEEHTSELQSLRHLVCRLLLE